MLAKLSNGIVQQLEHSSRGVMRLSEKCLEHYLLQIKRTFPEKNIL